MIKLFQILNFEEAFFLRYRNTLIKYPWDLRTFKQLLKGFKRFDLSLKYLFRKLRVKCIDKISETIISSFYNS